MDNQYTVNVHIGGVVQVKVSASNEDDAELLSITKVSQLISDKNTSIFELDAIDAEVVERIINIKNVNDTLANIKLKIRKKNE